MRCVVGLGVVVVVVVDLVVVVVLAVVVGLLLLLNNIGVAVGLTFGEKSEMELSVEVLVVEDR